MPPGRLAAAVGVGTLAALALALVLALHVTGSEAVDYLTTPCLSVPDETLRAACSESAAVARSVLGLATVGLALAAVAAAAVLYLEARLTTPA